MTELELMFQTNPIYAALAVMSVMVMGMALVVLVAAFFMRGCKSIQPEDDQ